MKRQVSSLLFRGEDGTRGHVSPQLHSCGIAEFRTPAAVAGEAATPSKRKLSLTFLHSRLGQNSRERPVTIGVGALFRDAQSLALAGKFETTEKRAKRLPALPRQLDGIAGC